MKQETTVRLARLATKDCPVPVVSPEEMVFAGLKVRVVLPVSLE